MQASQHQQERSRPPSSPTDPATTTCCLSGAPLSTANSRPIRALPQSGCASAHRLITPQRFRRATLQAGVMFCKDHPRMVDALRVRALPVARVAGRLHPSYMDGGPTHSGPTIRLRRSALRALGVTREDHPRVVNARGVWACPRASWLWRPAFGALGVARKDHPAAVDACGVRACPIPSISAIGAVGALAHLGTFADETLASSLTVGLGRATFRAEGLAPEDQLRVVDAVDVWTLPVAGARVVHGSLQGGRVTP